MRLLIDNALSPLVALEPTQAGYDTVHVRDHGLADASDVEILTLAEREDRIIISVDTDFGTLLTLRRQAKPSFILLRGRHRAAPGSPGSGADPGTPSPRRAFECGCNRCHHQRPDSLAPPFGHIRIAGFPTVDRDGT